MHARSHTENLAKPTLIIFDWDGTLFNSEPAVINAHQHARKTMHLPPLEDSAAETLLGLGKDAACHLATLGTNIAPEQYYQAFSSAYQQQKSHLDIFPEVREILTACQSNKILMALATNKTSIHAKKELMQAGLDAYFQNCQYADLAQAKPSPTMLNNILSNLDIKPKQAVMIGDQIPDILAAKHANIASITLYREKKPTWHHTHQHDTHFLTHRQLCVWVQQQHLMPKKQT